MILHTLPCLTPPSGTPWDVNVIYTPLKNAFNGLQFRRWHYIDIYIFIRLAVVASQNREIRRNSDKIWPYSSSRSSKIIDLGVNRKFTYDFLLVTIYHWGYLALRKNFIIFTFEYLLLLFKIFTFEGILHFFQQDYYQFWFEFSQNFVWFRRFSSRENVKSVSVIFSQKSLTNTENFDLPVAEMEPGQWHLPEALSGRSFQVLTNLIRGSV